jgi:CDP-paratose 2-epimerase
MTVALITGSAGLVGSEAARHFAGLGFDVVGVDNDMRAYFFGPAASCAWNRSRLQADLKTYTHAAIDIRDQDAVETLFRQYGSAISVIIHAAAQPSHDWAAKEPLVDFDVNARATLLLLEATRKHCPSAPFIYMSTNKVYGDTPNRLPLIDLEERWEIDPAHRYANGIDETMSIDASLHSLFGASKLAADLMVQEYGRYFGMPTVCFRGGCLTGPNHSAAQLHGFLAYLMHCALTRTPYTVFGYQGKQVRDNIHSYDVIQAFEAFRTSPRCGEVYNLGGGRFSNCSVKEAIRLCEELSGNTMTVRYEPTSRTGDHVWWITDMSRFMGHYPSWRHTRSLRYTLVEIRDAQLERMPER